MFRVSRSELRFPLPTLPRDAWHFQTTKSVIEKAAIDGELRVFIVSGEVSGDNIGSLLSLLKKLSHLPLRFHGVGGSLMCKEGLNPLFPMEDLAVMGVLGAFATSVYIPCEVEEHASVKKWNEQLHSLQ